jgi:8-oxo-dGTP diphosphatase
VTEVDGTTDAVGWVRVADIGSGAVDVLDLVTYALDLDRARPTAGDVHD